MYYLEYEIIPQYNLSRESFIVPEFVEYNELLLKLGSEIE